MGSKYGMLTPVNARINKLRNPNLWRELSNFYAKVCRLVMIQFSIPVSFVWSGLPLFWTKGLTVYGTDFTNWIIQVRQLNYLHFPRQTRQETHRYWAIYPQKRLVLCPFDATVIPLMSKLFWLQGYRQLKLITALHQDTKSTGHLIISPRQEHEINFGEDMVKMLPENGIAVGDRSKATLFSLSAFQLEMGRKPSCRYETQYKLCYDQAGITISFQEPCSRSRMPDQSNP